jgi:tetratricopeptide (TPR) repeat protein
MIRHHVYFDVLGSLPEDSASWRSVFAGLSVLRLVDSYVDGDPASNPGHWAQLHTVRTAIESVSEGDPIRTVLMHVLEELSTRRALDDTVSSAILAYGRALDYEASWGLATDVFATVAKVVKPERNPRLVVEANIAVGGAARRNGDWETSARAYSQAAYIADTLSDRPGVLTVQVGIANTYIAKGNLPQAQTILDDIVMQARDQQLPELESFALHSRAAIAQIRGDHAEGVKLAYEAFNLSVKPVERDLILADIAAGLSELGMRDAARDAHLILAATSQAKRTRWQATINLLELASLDGMEQAFDLYASELRNAPMGVWLRSHFLLIFGEGLARFGKFEAAEEILQEAERFASANQIHRVAFQAEAALSQVASGVHHAQKQAAGALFARPTDDILNVVHGLTQLKAAAAAH